MMIDDADAHSSSWARRSRSVSWTLSTFIEPGGRFIEQKLRRASAERDRYAEAPQIAERHLIRHLVGERL